MDDTFPDPHQVTSRTELSAFVLALRDDLARNTDAWENPTLDRYLEALARWIHDMDGWFANQDKPEPAQPTWRLVAEMLQAASIYE